MLDPEGRVEMIEASWPSSMDPPRDPGQEFLHRREVEGEDVELSEPGYLSLPGGRHLGNVSDDLQSHPGRLPPGFQDWEKG